MSEQEGTSLAEETQSEEDENHNDENVMVLTMKTLSKLPVTESKLS